MTTTTPATPQTAVTRLTGRLSQCTGCGEVFSCTTAFDSHRAWHTGQRVCLNPAANGLIIGQRKAGTFWKAPASEDMARFTQSAA